MSELFKEIEFEEYPWSINLYDFENMLEMTEYLNFSPDDFIRYIEWRVKTHSKIISSDELEIFEVFNSETEITEIEEKIFIPILNYSLIDKIYFEKKGHPYYHPDFKKSIKKSSIKVGRNEPCPCGSGKKFKKCCIEI